MKKLWDKNQEIRFFTEARKFASLEQLFYVSDEGRRYAYWPKNYKGSKTTLQARNALIGNVLLTIVWLRSTASNNLSILRT